MSDELTDSERESWRREAQFQADRAEAAEAKLAAIDKLHSCRDEAWPNWCTECAEPRCATRRILDGKADDE